MKYINNSIKSYLSDLAGNKPAPGGGSGSALGASIGVSLLLMVANFTKGKKGYKQVQSTIKGIIKELSLYKRELEFLIDADIRAYENVNECLKMPKIPKRKRLLTRALIKAAKVPFRVCEISHLSLKAALTLASKGNKNLMTDVGCGALFLEAAIVAGRLNVDINLKYLKGIKFAKRASIKLDKWQKESAMLKNSILASMWKML